jgi:hypothetical protein
MLEAYRCQKIDSLTGHVQKSAIHFRLGTIISLYYVKFSYRFVAFVVEPVILSFPLFNESWIPRRMDDVNCYDSFDRTAHLFQFELVVSVADNEIVDNCE